MTKQIWIVTVLGVLILGAGIYLLLAPAPVHAPTTNNDLPIVDPSQTGQPTYTNATPDLIQVALPFPGAVVGKEFAVTGKARGTWYFEASFPVTLLDKDGNVLAQGPAQAEGDWMTQDFVPFKINLKVDESYIGPATLILKNDNPSGLPENDRSVSFPITVEY